MRRTLIGISVVLLMAIVAVSTASADLINGGHKQTDFPEASLYVQVIDPYTDEPLLLPVGPDGKMVEASPKQAPKNSIIRVKVLAAGGSRDISWVKLRLGDGRPAFVLKAPYVYDIETRRCLVGPYLVEAVIMTTEGRWAAKSAAFYVDAKPIADYFPKTQQPARTVNNDLSESEEGVFIGPEPSLPDPPKLRPPARRTTITCTYSGVGMRVKVNDVLDIFKGDEPVGRVKVTKVTQRGFSAVVILGSAPAGSEVCVGGDR